MTLELLANQGREKVYSNLAGRTYGDILAKRNALKDSFTDINDVEHKLEVVAKIKDVEYVNDACSTNPNATWFSMESIASSIVWIASGENTTNDYTSLIPICREKVKALICFGENSDRLKRTFAGLVSSIVVVNNMSEAVVFAGAYADANDVVLYSPASGNPHNYKEKGIEFRNSVNEL